MASVLGPLPDELLFPADTAVILLGFVDSFLLCSTRSRTRVCFRTSLEFPVIWDRVDGRSQNRGPLQPAALAHAPAPVQISLWGQNTGEQVDEFIDLSFWNINNLHVFNRIPVPL